MIPLLQRRSVRLAIAGAVTWVIASLWILLAFEPFGGYRYNEAEWYTTIFLPPVVSILAFALFRWATKTR